MILNKAGRELFSKWDDIYRTELERLRKERNDPEYIEGWSIIDSYDFVKTANDEIGLLIFGYDDSLPWMFDEEWSKAFDEDEVFFKDADGKGYTVDEMREMCRPYYDGWD